MILKLFPLTAIVLRLLWKLLNNFPCIVQSFKCHSANDLRSVAIVVLVSGTLNSFHFLCSFERKVCWVHSGLLSCTSSSLLPLDPGPSQTTAPDALEWSGASLRERTPWSARGQSQRDDHRGVGFNSRLILPHPAHHHLCLQEMRSHTWKRWAQNAKPWRSTHSIWSDVCCWNYFNFFCPIFKFFSWDAWK